MRLVCLYSSVFDVFRDRQETVAVVRPAPDEASLLVVLVCALVVTSCTTVLFLVLYLRKERQFQAQRQAQSDADEAAAVIGAETSVGTAVYIQSADCRAIIDGCLERGGAIGRSEWQEIRRLVESAAPSWTDDFKLHHAVSSFELEMCCLIKLGYSPASISVLLARSPSAITMARKRLYAKIHRREGTAKDLDNYILALPLPSSAEVRE